MTKTNTAIASTLAVVAGTGVYYKGNIDGTSRVYQANYVVKRMPQVTLPDNQIEALIQPKALTVPAKLAGFDFDMDGDIDGVDSAKFISCYNKAGRPPRTGPHCSQIDAMFCDWNDDGDVDNHDFAEFALCYNGAGKPYGRSNCTHQLQRRYRISGRITDTQGRPIPGVEVRLETK